MLKFITIPIIINEESRKEPPYEMNGKGSPLTGIIPEAIEQLTKIWERKIVEIPTKTKLENLSFALWAKLIIFNIK